MRSAQFKRQTCETVSAVIFSFPVPHIPHYLAVLVNSHSFTWPSSLTCPPRPPPSPGRGPCPPPICRSDTQPNPAGNPWFMWDGILLLVPWPVFGTWLHGLVMGRADCLIHPTRDWTPWYTSCCLCSWGHWTSSLRQASRRLVPHPYSPFPVYSLLPTLALRRSRVPVPKPAHEPAHVTIKPGAKSAPVWSAGFLKDKMVP